MTGHLPFGITQRTAGYTLRHYQEEAVSSSVAFLRRTKPGNGICICPTGSGKSLILANIIHRLDGPALVFQPSKEILEQNVAKMESYGYRPGIYSASIGRRQVRDITFATIGSVKNVPEMFREFPYILIDECHFVNAKGGMYRDFLNNLENARVLGLTATPYRLASNSFGSELRFLTRTRPRIFKEVVYYCQNSTLFDAGYLARLEYREMPGFDRGRLRTNSTGAEFDDASVRKYFSESGFIQKTCDIVKQVQFTRRNCLVFTRFIEESEYLVSRIPQSAIVTGETPKRERERILSAFKAGEIKVVTNVGVLTTGFDFPELETVILARPTMSLGLYYQMIGRGIRPHENKRSCLVVDLCGNVRSFGRIEDLKINGGDDGKWFISSKGKQLTNVIMGQPAPTHFRRSGCIGRPEWRR